MRKRFFLTLIALFTAFSMSSQPEFGLKGGVSIALFNEDQGIFGENPDAEFGYFAGAFVDFFIDNGFHIQPELLYKGIGDFEFLNAPIYLKYDVDNNFHLLAGPSLNYFFNFFADKFRVRGDVSLSYDITDDLDLNLKYTIGFEEISPNIVFLGLGYRL